MWTRTVSNGCFTLSFQRMNKPLFHSPTGMRQVHFELNGAPRTVSIPDEEYSGDVKIREKANPALDGDVGAPMPVSLSFEKYSYLTLLALLGFGCGCSRKGWRCRRGGRGNLCA